jgi:hypothetical protein
MAFERYNTGQLGNINIPERIIKIEGYTTDEKGNLVKGDYPKEYLRKLNAYLSTPSILSVKNQNEINFDFRNIININRIFRDSTPDESYEVLDLIDELNSEAAALGNISRSKEGKYNLAYMTNSSISVSEATTTTKDGSNNKSGSILDWFRRKGGK